MRKGELLQAPFGDWRMTRSLKDTYRGIGRPRRIDYTVDIQKLRKTRAESKLERKLENKGIAVIKKPNKPRSEWIYVRFIWQVAIFMGFVSSLTDLILQLQERF